ncbi:MAG: S-adenosylmethionine:tRNA ribosyltransferase-isomerase [Rikenellaceae bacterium]|jgi:S-adenosylmethionine:tRNA ribosyltransferase-isomerase|nr:S-adenosylmethionine:tRNA ribosyltransferase-isomerase [Rikenellaceae bacterium]
MVKKIDISQYDYALDDGRIAKFPPHRREDSRLLTYRGGAIDERRFAEVGETLPTGTLLVFNNTRVVRARIVMHRASGARIELFCLEPASPADYERAFAARSEATWHCMVGNAKRWKDGALIIDFEHDGRIATLSATRVATASADAAEASRQHRQTPDTLVRFEWDADLAFGELLELLGRVPIPPYLGREIDETDACRYQTVYALTDGSVAAPTAGLHFSDGLLNSLRQQGFDTEYVTLHVGAGTFLPVKGDDAAEHPMHAEHFEVALGALARLRKNAGHIVAVGTTTTRTLESLVALGWRVARDGGPEADKIVGQWELYDIPESFAAVQALDALIAHMKTANIDRLKASTRIMIAPGYRLRMVNALITNFHQPRSTLLLLVAALVGDDWRRIYDYAMSHDFSFLSYGDSSILFPHE